MERYLGKVSGPLLDRIDLHIEVPAVPFEELSSTRKEEPSSQIRQRVNAARQRQNQRFEGKPYACNADIPAGDLQEMCQTTQAASQLLGRAFESFGFSARTYGRVLKVARTIADLEGSEKIDTAHAAEAVQYRTLEPAVLDEQVICQRPPSPSVGGAASFLSSLVAVQIRNVIGEVVAVIVHAHISACLHGLLVIAKEEILHSAMRRFTNPSIPPVFHWRKLLASTVEST